jgi:hypothetical protein
MGGALVIEVSGPHGTRHAPASEVTALVRRALTAEQVGDLALEHPDGPTLSILFAESRAFIMALAGERDVGEVAVDPQSEGDRRPIRFTLDNGQVDTWPVESTVSYDQTEPVVKAWAAQQRWHGVHWTDEPFKLVDHG